MKELTVRLKNPREEYFQEIYKLGEKLEIEDVELGEFIDYRFTSSFSENPNEVSIIAEFENEEVLVNFKEK